MNINATIFGQMLTFGIFIWVNKRFIWPKILGALNEREQKISKGLEAGELGEQKLLQAKDLAKQQELETKKYCNLLIKEAKNQAEHILELTMLQAKNQEDQIINQALVQIEQEKHKAAQELQLNLAELITKGIENIITTSLTTAQHQQILTNISKQLL